MDPILHLVVRSSGIIDPTSGSTDMSAYIPPQKSDSLQKVYFLTYSYICQQKHTGREGRRAPRVAGICLETGVHCSTVVHRHRSGPRLAACLIGYRPTLSRSRHQPGPATIMTTRRLVYGWPVDASFIMSLCRLSGLTEERGRLSRTAGRHRWWS